MNHHVTFNTMFLVNQTGCIYVFNLGLLVASKHMKTIDWFMKQAKNNLKRCHCKCRPIHLPVSHLNPNPKTVLKCQLWTCICYWPVKNATSHYQGYLQGILFPEKNFLFSAGNLPNSLVCDSMVRCKYLCCLMFSGNRWSVWFWSRLAYFIIEI